MSAQLLQSFPGGPEIAIVLLMLFIVVGFVFVVYRIAQGIAILSE